MNTKKITGLFFLINICLQSWSPMGIVGAAVGGAALLGAGAMALGGLFGKNDEEKRQKEELVRQLADLRVKKSEKESELNGVRSKLDQDLSNLKITMNILTDGVRDKIDDLYTLVRSGSNDRILRTLI